MEPENLELIRTEGREIICYDKLKNRYRISHVSAGFNGSLALVMKNGIADYISRSFRKSFKERRGLQ